MTKLKKLLNEYFINVNKALTSYKMDKEDGDGGVTYGGTCSTPVGEVISNLGSKVVYYLTPTEEVISNLGRKLLNSRKGGDLN